MFPISMHFMSKMLSGFKALILLGMLVKVIGDGSAIGVVRKP